MKDKKQEAKSQKTSPFWKAYTSSTALHNQARTASTKHERAAHQGALTMKVFCMSSGKFALPIPATAFTMPAHHHNNQLMLINMD